MRRRGRISASNLTTAPVDAGVSRLEPPAFLSKAEQALFREVVACCDSRHFRASDMSLLCGYVQAAILARTAIGRAGEDPAALQIWEKSTRVMTSLSSRLRISPQARFDRKTVGSREVPRGPKPWQQKD